MINIQEKYYQEIKSKLIENELYDRVKDYSKDRNKVKVYFETGKLLHDAGKEYGKNIIRQYAEKLTIEVGKKYNYRTLYRMRKFYEVFNNEKLTTLLSKLSWSYFNEVLSIKEEDKIIYYLNVCINKTLTIRQLQAIIKNKEYERLPIEDKNKIINRNKLILTETIPNPIIIKDNENYEKFTEYVLKELILNNLDEFLMQLGYGFSYIGKEYKIKIGDKYNYIDLLLFNIEFNCYVVVELKITELKKEHIGQIQFYMNYIDKKIKKSFHNKTVGIIICKKNNQYVIDYCSDTRIISREYILI